MDYPIEIFCCAAEAEQDRSFLEKLSTHLALQRQQGIINLWDRSHIVVGRDVDEEIRLHLTNARIFLLLISADFLNDDYCYNQVMKVAFERHARGEAITIPVLIRPANWQGVRELKRIQVIPRDGHPISGHSDQDTALLEVAHEINAAIQNLEESAVSVKSGSEFEREPYGQLPLMRHEYQVGSEKVYPSPKGRGKKVNRILFIFALVLVVIILLGGVFFYGIPFLSHTTYRPTLTTPANAASTPTATVNVGSTPTNDLTSSLIPPGQSPAVDDPLQNNNQGYEWDEQSLPTGSCHFIQGQYLLAAPAGSSGIDCNPENAKGIFSNFVYQIKMTILTGLDNGAAGLTFRVNTTGNGQQYQVTFNALGDWQVATDLKPLTSISTPCGSPCQFFHPGVNVSNVITTFVSGNSIQIQINGHPLGSCTDSTYASGSIGVALTPGNENSSVVFSNVRVWKL